MKALKGMCATVCVALQFYCGVAAAHHGVDACSANSDPAGTYWYPIGPDGYLRAAPGLQQCFNTSINNRLWGDPAEWFKANEACEGTYLFPHGGWNGEDELRNYWILYCKLPNPNAAWCEWSDSTGYHEGATNAYRHCKTPYYFVATPDIDGPNLGSPDCCVGNPINPANGNKLQVEIDYQGTGQRALTFSRHYNSQDTRTGALGLGWRHTYSRSLKKEYGQPPTYIPNSADQSPLYPSKEAACVQGWQQIRTRSLGLAATNAAYANDICTLYDGTRPIRDIAVYSNVGWPPFEPPPVVAIVANRYDGSAHRFLVSGSEFISEDGTSASLTTTADGYRYTENDISEDYDQDGRLLAITDKTGSSLSMGYNSQGKLSTVTDAYGRSLTFEFDPEGRLTKLVDPDNKNYLFAFNANGDLSSIVYPGTVERQYHYGEQTSFPRALTGVTDENGDRFATWRYDAQGRAISSEHAGGSERIDITYESNGGATVSDSAGAEEHYLFGKPNGIYKSTSVSRACIGCNNASSSTTYDANGFVASRADFTGNVTTYVHDTRGLETSRTEAYGTPQSRTISTQWHSSYRLPVLIDEPGRTTTFSYDASGNLLARTVTDTATNDSRTTAYTYTGLGLLSSVDGPRTDVSDVTNYDYDTQGNLTRITNALSQITEIPDYDAHGNPLRIVDPNGVETVLTYDVRQRLKTRTVGGATTSFDYDGVGQIIKVTLPDGAFVEYDYDAAHRLTDMTDGDGNRIHYTLDAAGNRTQEEVRDPQNALRRRQSQVFDALGRLTEIRNATSQTIQSFGYDAQGNRTSATEPGQSPTAYAYDALNRPYQVTDAANGVTGYEYDALGRLSAVVDPKTLRTDYQYNAFGDLLSQSSPDTGVTTFTYDAAGNRTSQTDARGITVQYVYDALNRLVSVDYPGTAEDVAYHYDGSNYLAPMAYGVGRLSGIDDESGSTTLLYDTRGNLVEAQRIWGGQTHTTRYAYDAADRLTGMTYPTGRQVAYERDAQGQVTRVTTTADGVTQTVAQNITYLPFGGVASYVLGNGVSVVRTFDQDYRLEEQQDQGTQPLRQVRLYHDARYNIEAIEDLLHPDRSQAFGYDALSRLTSAEGLYGSLAYGYDATGNRLSETRTPIGGSAPTDTYSYPAGSHRLESITGGNSISFDYDAAGAVTGKSGLTLTYNAAHRATTASLNGSSVQSVYSATGQRAAKASGPEQIVFHYDRGGQLIAETASGGDLIQREYVWLDDLPLQIDAVGVRREVVTDNSDPAVSATGSWGSATAQTGYYGADYLTHGPAGVPAGTVVVDDSDANTSKTGLWTPAPSGQANEGNLQSAGGGASNTRFNWLPSVPAAGRYQVYARWYWSSLGNLIPAASQAPYAVQHAQGTTTVVVNQQIDQGRWNLLGTYDFAAGQTQISVIAGNAGGRLIADAVRLVPIEIDGTATVDQVRWRAPDAATYQVYARWPASGAHTPFAGFTVEHAGGTAAIIRNQRTDGGQWNLLGTFSFTDLSTQGVSLSASPNDTVVADAVRFAPTPESQIKRQIGYVHVDHLNTPQLVTDPNQQAIWEASYEPFGSATLLTNQIDNPLRFPGQYLDDETGLQQNWWRDYSTGEGRYLQSDPIGLAGGLNTYSYAGQNPLTFTDPTGQFLFALPWVAEGVWASWQAITAWTAVATVATAVATIPSDQAISTPADPNNCPDDKCKQIEAEISAAMREIQGRTSDMLADPLKLFNLAYETPNPAATGTSTTWLGHVQQLQGWQRRLRNAISDAQRNGCKVPSGAYSQAYRPIPTAPGPKG